jgi:hypothetical protein
MRPSRISSTIAQANLYVSVALAKTHVNTMLTGCLKNQMSCLHPHDRIQMHGYQAGGNGYTGLKHKMVQWLKGDSPAVAYATTALGRAKQAAVIAQQITGRLTWEKLSKPQVEFVKSVAAMHTNLVRLNQAVKPRLALVDGFSAMDGEGPRFGRSRNLGWVVAGSDPVAVDSVVAHLMGLQLGDIGIGRRPHPETRSPMPKTQPRPASAIVERCPHGHRRNTPRPCISTTIRLSFPSPGQPTRFVCPGQVCFPLIRLRIFAKSCT